jgi:hypothetical protein
MGIIERACSLIRNIRVKNPVNPEKHLNALPAPALRAVRAEEENIWEEWPINEGQLTWDQVFSNVGMARLLLIDSLQKCPEFLQAPGEPNYRINATPAETNFKKNGVDYRVSYFRSVSGNWITIARHFETDGWDKLDVNEDGLIEYKRCNLKLKQEQTSTNTYWAASQVEKFIKDIES